MNAENARLLGLLEVAHAEAVQAGSDLRATWKQEDHALAEARRALWEAHEQGARDRDAMRVQLGGESLIEADKRASEAAAAKLKAEAKPDAKASAK